MLLSKKNIFFVIFAFFLTVSFCESTYASTTAFVFNKNLKQGDRLSDVRELQKLLNKFPNTVISASGDGSPGSETDFFGVLTKAAVIRFQNAYKGDVLTPIGLTSGDGIVGTTTRKKLNQIEQALLISTSTTATSTRIGTGTGTVSTTTTATSSSSSNDVYSLITSALTGVSMSSGISSISGSTGGIGMFGGQVLKVTYCTCPSELGASALTLLDPTGGTTQMTNVKFSPLMSKLNLNNNVWTTNACVLGGHNSTPTNCMVIAGTSCSDSGVQPILGTVDFIRGIGTTASAGCTLNNQYAAHVSSSGSSGTADTSSLASSGNGQTSTTGTTGTTAANTPKDNFNLTIDVDGNQVAHPSRTAIDTDGVGEAPFHDPDHQSQTSLYGLDANIHDYVVVPIGSKIPMGTRVLVADYTSGITVQAIVGDAGPTANGYGEISLHLAETIGAWKSGMGNSANNHDVTYTFKNGTRTKVTSDGHIVDK